MSSLLSSYRKLTNPVTQGVFNIEEDALNHGRIYEGSLIEETFGSSAVIDFVISAGDELLSISDLTVTTTSEEYITEVFLSPAFTDGTPIVLFNQLAGSPRLTLASMVVSPTVTDDGTPGPINIIRGVAGQGNSGSFSENNRQASILIQPNTSVLFRVINQGAVGELDLTVRLGEASSLTPGP